MRRVTVPIFIQIKGEFRGENLKNKKKGGWESKREVRIREWWEREERNWVPPTKFVGWREKNKETREKVLLSFKWEKTGVCNLGTHLKEFKKKVKKNRKGQRKNSRSIYPATGVSPFTRERPSSTKEGGCPERERNQGLMHKGRREKKKGGLRTLPTWLRSGRKKGEKKKTNH